MKNLLVKIVKAAASWALGYAGAAAAWTLDHINGKLQGKAWVASVAAWARDTAAFLTSFAGALEDGAITEEERLRVTADAQRLADRAKGLIEDAAEAEKAD